MIAFLGSVKINLSASLSNGFKLRMSHAGQDENAENYIYVAFAETEQKYSNAR